MDQDHSGELDQFFDFELASGTNGFDIDQWAEEEDLFPDPMSHNVPGPTLPASFGDFDGDNTACIASAHDAFSSTVFADKNDLSINIPSFWRPAAPCDYCASRQLDCFFLIENQNCCNSCTSLFRACSFSNPAARAPRGYLDTLSSVAEDTEQQTGFLTSTKPLFSLGASMNDILDDIIKSKPERTTTRFARTTTIVLKKWLDAHSDHPYPNEEEKEELKEQTGLSRSQISNWLANARRRGKVRPKRCVSPSLHLSSTSRPINVPVPEQSSGSKHQAHMTPFERWKESPPENEPASISAISRAAVDTQFTPGQSGSSSQSHSLADQHRSSTSAGSAFRAPSISSLETGRSGRSSGSMESTNGSSYSYGSRSSYNSYGGRDRRRRRRAVPKLPRAGAATQAQKIFQCTFCTDTFHIKYDWTRHEKSLHLSLEKWRCAPLGPVVTSAADGSTQCVYCQTPNPTPEHAETHNHSECVEKGCVARTFYRKDHLRQHLRLVHNVQLSPIMEAWKSAPDIVRSRCGFCPQENPTTFTTWQDRADHLTRHFREGALMIQWKGDWGFEPVVAAQVTNAMPPWMIGEELNTPNPFTACRGAPPPRDNIDVQRDSIPACEFSLGRATQGKVSTCWEVLTVLLGQFVKTKMKAGEDLSDEVLQRQARIILYDDDDEWNQTAADNAEWLRLFKQAHGIGGERQPSSGAEGGSAGKRDSIGSSLVGAAAGAFTVDGGGGGDMIIAQDDIDDQFRQVFEDAGIFGMDFDAPPAPQSMEPSYMGGSLPHAPHIGDEFTYDFEDDFMGHQRQS